MCKYLNIMRTELVWMYFPYSSLVDPLFVENKSHELIPYPLDAAETSGSSNKNQSTLLEFDSKNIRINYDFLRASHHRKPKVAFEIMETFL